MRQPLDKILQVGGIIVSTDRNPSCPYRARRNLPCMQKRRLLFPMAAFYYRLISVFSVVLLYPYQERTPILFT